MIGSGLEGAATAAAASARETTRRRQLHSTSEQVAPLRARLISKGLVETPRFAYAKFTVPQFDKFRMRFIPDPSGFAPAKPTKTKMKASIKKGRS